MGSTTTNLAWGRGRGRNQSSGGRGRGALFPSANADQAGRLERLEATFAQQQEAIARLQWENAELSRLRPQEGSAEQVNREATASIADGHDAELEINMDLNSEGEETTGPSQ